MAKCEDCSYFFDIPEKADDYELGKADCVIEKRDEKGTYWLSKTVFKDDQTFSAFSIKTMVR